MTALIPLDPRTMERLALIRLLYQQAADQAALPEPLNVSCVPSLHDAAELYLDLVARKLDPKLPKFVEFMGYFKAIKQAAGQALNGERNMAQVNDLRVALKHYGTLPSKSAIDQACAHVREFFEANTLLIFGTSFASIDMAEVIPQADARAKVKAAAAAAAAGHLDDAMGELAETFDLLTRDPDLPAGRRSFGRFGPTIRPTLREDQIKTILAKPAGDLRGPTAGTFRLAREIADVVKASREMQAALRMMAIGIDYREYDRFRRLTPQILYFVDGHTERRPPTASYGPTDEEFGFCRQFIITLALRMAELETHTRAASWESA